MSPFSYIVGAAIILFFVFSVFSFIRSLVLFIKSKKAKKVQSTEPELEPDVNATDNLNEEV